METRGKFAIKLEELDPEDVLSLLQKWDMDEFGDFVKEKELDGRKLMDKVVKTGCPALPLSNYQFQILSSCHTTMVSDG
ncbi:unnamed protein product [Parnassius apollo]|uniref:(apollo) hypothetical protein n=1 Tax=Parnassius apollo TaxID=110799 RepID=A0A8S3W8D3_PARAO|nr:unnamed protein product [Parnassius apollo]